MANKKLKVNRNRYDFGGAINSIPSQLLNYSQNAQNAGANTYMEQIANPDAFHQEAVMKHAVEQQASKNDWLMKGFDILGHGLIDVGVGLMGSAADKQYEPEKYKNATKLKDKIKNFDNSGFGRGMAVGTKKFGGLFGGLLHGIGSMFSDGGVAGEEQNIEHVPIEAEGGEMIAMPWDNEAVPIEGASHENGGVDMTVPVGSKIYSKRVKDAKGVSMAKRKERRDRELKKWEKIVNDDPNNKIAKDTLEKVRRNNEIEEANDMAYMKLHKAKKQFSDYIKYVTKDYGKGGGLNIAIARQASDDVHSMFGGEYVNEQGVPKYAGGAEVTSQAPVSISQEKQALYNYLKNISDEFGHIYKNANTTKKDNRGDILFQSSKNANDLANLVLSALGEDAKTANWKKKNAIYKIVSELFGNVNRQGNFVYNVGGKRKSVVQFIKDKFAENGIFGEGTTEEQKQKAYSNFITSLNNIKGRPGILGKISNKDGNNELNIYLPKDNNTTNTVFDNIVQNTNTTVNPSYTSALPEAFTTNTTDTSKGLFTGKPLPSLNELSLTKPASLTNPVSLTEKIGSNSSMDLGIIPDLSSLTPDQLDKVIEKIELGDGKTALTNPDYAKDWLAEFIAKNPLPESANNYKTTENIVKGQDNNKKKDTKLGKLFDALSDNLNSGNALQLAGIIHNMRKPMQAVLDNFRGKAQYRNFYRDYGKKSLLELDNMQDNIRQIRDENLRDLSDRQAAMTYSNNNSARDINVARAMNLATLSQITDAANNAYANYASMNNDVHKLRANTLTDIDSKVMGEDKWADQMNREMRDSFFANKLEAQKAIGMGLQQMGKLFNRERYIKELKKHYEEMEKERRAATANNNIRLTSRTTIG